MESEQLSLFSSDGIKEEIEKLRKVLFNNFIELEQKNSISFIVVKFSTLEENAIKDFNLEEICNCTSIPEGKYLVLGDNRPISKDSRTIGLVDEKDILGKAVYRIWPISKFGSIY